MSSDQKTPQPETHPVKKAWQRPELTPAGRVGDVLQGGTGKMTVLVGDPGESQKVPSMDM
jgi:hypothetical protein